MGTTALEILDGLSFQQDQFVKEFHLTGNAKQAALKAGYSEKTAESQGSRLLSTVKVQQALIKLQKESEESYGIRKQELIDELKIMAFGCVSDILDWTADEVTIKPKSDIHPSKRRFIESIQYEKRMESTGETDPETGKDIFAPVYKIKVTTLGKQKAQAIKMLGQLVGLWKDEKATAAGDVFNTQNNLVFVAEWGTGAPLKKVTE